MTSRTNGVFVKAGLAGVLGVSLFLSMFGADDIFVLNPGFEDGQGNIPSDWKPSVPQIMKPGIALRTDAEKHSGKYSMFMQNDSIKSGLKSYSIGQKINIQPMENYNFSVWIKSDLRGGLGEDVAGCILTGFDKTGKAVQGRSSGLKLKEGTRDWTKYEIMFQPAKEVTYIYVTLFLNPGLAIGKIWFDDVYLGRGNKLLKEKVLTTYRKAMPYSTPFDEELKKAYSRILHRKVMAAAGTPLIDGELDDAAWGRAPLIENFLALSPDLTTASAGKTEAKILYDKENIYFSVKCFLPPNTGIKAEKVLRDSNIWDQEGIQLFISPDNRTDKFYQLALNPAGSIWDGISTIKAVNKNDLSEMRKYVDVNWNPDWKNAVKIGNGFWQAEIAIPYKVLDTQAPSVSDHWSLNICRNGSCISSMTVSPLMKFTDATQFGVCGFDSGEELKKIRDEYIEYLEEYARIKKQYYDYINDDLYKFKHAFAMVGTGSPRKNFIPVKTDTLYSKEKGFGWRNIQSLRSPSPAKVIDHCGHKSSLNDLTRQYIAGKDGEFLADLPNGEYTVHMIVGDSVDVPPVFEVLANGEKKLKVSIPQNFIFNIYSFPVEIKNGQLALQFKGEYGFLLNGLIIQKNDEGELATKQMQRIWEEINLGNPDWVTRCQRYEHVEDLNAQGLASLDNGKEYILFTRNYLDLVYPNTIPRQNELNDKVQINAAPGETEPVAWGILPTKDIPEFNVKTADFTDGKGNKISNENIKLNMVEYKYEKLVHYRCYKYALMPSFLKPLVRSDLKKGIARQIWMNIKVPANTPPGNYNGRINLYSGNKAIGSATISLLVYPFELDPLNDYTLGVFYRVSPRCPERGIDGWTRTYAELMDMKEHNMNSVGLSLPASRDHKNYNFGKRGEINPDEILKFLRLAKNVGLNRPVPYYLAPFIPYDTQNAIKIYDIKPSDWQYVKAAIDKIKETSLKEELPELLCFPVDEPHWFRIRQGNAANILKYFKNEINTRTFMTVTPENKSLFSLLDVIALGGGERALEIASQKENAQKEIWAYNSYTSGAYGAPFSARFITGFITWKQQVKGFQLFHYLEPYAANPFNPIDSLYAAFVYPGDDGPLPTLQWEAVREGVDDLKYLRTLEKLIKKLSDSKDEAVVQELAKANEFLAQVRNEISPLISDYTFDHPETGEPIVIDPTWPISKYDQMRTAIAQWIMRLKEVEKLQLKNHDASKTVGSERS